MKLEKNPTVTNIFPAIIRIVFIGAILLIIADILFFSDFTEYFTKKNFLLSNRTLLAVSIGICVLLSFLLKMKKQAEYSYKQIVLSLSLASLILFIFQLIIISNMYFYPGWDAGGIRNAVFEISNGTYNIWYQYSRFPSQINITALMVGIVKLSNLLGIDGYFGTLFVSALFVNLAGVFTFLCTYHITKSTKFSIFSWIIFTLWVGLSPWISIPYTDTYSILFPILAFYLYVSRKPEEKSGIRWFFIGLLCIYGSTIKQTVIIVLVAIIIVELLNALAQKDKKIWINLIFSFAMILLSVVPVLIIKSYSKDVIGIELNDEEDFSVYHLAMMGLNEETNGVFSQDDVDFSASFMTIEERNSKNLEVIQQRLNDYGFFGYLKFLAKKTLVIFSDGSFAWGVEGNFYQIIPERTNRFALFLQDVYYNVGTHNQLFMTLEQILWFVVLLFLPLMSMMKQKPDRNEITLMLIVLGFIFGILLFEARARYVYHFSTFFVLGASIGLGKVIEKLTSKTNSQSKNI